MTPEKQRSEIAKLCDWKPDLISTDLDGNPWPSDPPDYLNDLNAVHELEKKLDQSQCHIYTEHLASSPQDGTWAGCCMWHISAAQRCEALLRVFNKWEETT